MKTRPTTTAVAAERGFAIRKEMRIAMGITLFALLTAAGAYVRIPLPFTPVPVTLQVFFVLLAGLMLGPVYGSMSQILYVALGGLGLPMFTLGGLGFAYLLGPTGGYIIGFVIAQAVVGTISGRLEIETISLPRVALALAAGIFLIYGIGATHLMVVTGMSLKQALAAGVLPFVGADMIKAACAAACFLKMKDHLKSLL